ncbi:neural cell adhesion molecule 1-like [Actinia tenebrosa]|uniref:Neural cell adhesion molecule 1-like n=1 Tax=Actinia tenebrosa TaxID=6105 RepID=A0A6P8J4J4_ACTTE|nr:neural cell adhesion molecule 1-like [Actinia tenebrosa]
MLYAALPRINYLDPSLYGKRGDSITLRCYASGYPAPRVAWTHQDTKRTITNSSVTSFKITGKESGGKYCCHVSNDFGNETNCTSLEVIVLPRVKNLTFHLSGKQGESITLRCNASGDPAPRITWIHKDTNRTIANSSVTSFNITGKASGGKYCCHVSNGFGEETNCTSVKVTEYQPINAKLTSDMKFATANKTFEVFCNADASPPANYSIKQGNITMGGSHKDEKLATLIEGIINKGYRQRRTEYLKSDCL